jgi:hypothetical protein
MPYQPNPNQYGVYTHISREEAAIVPDLLGELIGMGRDCRYPINHEDRDVYLGEDYKPRTREIGETLNRLGGFQLMVWVADQIPPHDHRVLEAAWDGIGEWRS